MASRYTVILSLLWLIITIFDVTKSQPANTPSTTIEIEADAFPAHWVMMMLIFGFLGIIIIPSLCIHALINFRKTKIVKPVLRVLYAIFFFAYFSTCFAYALFRTDLIFPMGSVISCTFGYYYSTSSFTFSKVMLWVILMYRIDLAFHSSAMGYSRVFLGCVFITIICITLGLYGGIIMVTKDIVGFEEASYFNGAITGVCTSGSGESKYGGLYTLVIGSTVLCDFIANIILCLLFTYKLRIVIRMGADCSGKDKKLQKLMRKQTVLVLVVCVTSIGVLGLGAVLSGFSLIMPLDATVNAFCIWLMFSFSDPIWNKLTHYCCYCCQCCGHKEDFMMTLHSMRSIRGSSLRQEVMSTTARSPSVPRQRVEDHEDEDAPPPISERVSQKHADIDIKFKNNITSDDLR